MNLPLFSVFAPTTKEAWKQQVIKDLKGKDFDTTLLWETPEGITMPPYYTEEDLTDHRLGELQSVQKKMVGWLNSSTILFENELFTNSKMLALIQQGVNIIQLDLRQVDIHNIEFTRLLNGIKLSQTPIYFQTNNQDTALLSVLQKIIPYQIKGGCTYDGLSQWMQTGESSTTSFEELKERLIQAASSPQFRAICVDSSVFHNAGANAVQELAFTLSAAVTYIDKLTDLDIAFELVLQKLYFSMAVGTHYFMEIAKLRALRYLWAKISKQFEQIPTLAPKPAAFSTCIFAQTSTFYDTVLSPHTNMIRATTEAMSAVIGGCDVLSVHGYDTAFRPSDDFSERIAKNISIILKEEALFDKVADPSAGSYYIENLTLQLIDAAWTLFLEIETKGGLMSAFEQNFIQELIEKSYDYQLSALKNHKSRMVGVNSLQEAPTVSTIQSSQPINDSTLKLLINKRISRDFEH